MAQKYQFTINVNAAANNAGSKAVEDCSKILNEQGYHDLQIYFTDRPQLLVYNAGKLLLMLLYYLIAIEKGSLVFVQYPLKGGKRLFGYFIQLLRRKKCFAACIIHDLDSLRYQRAGSEVKKEIGILNIYNTVITHNAEMTGWLQLNGLHTQVIELGIFDYLYTDEQQAGITHPVLRDKHTVVFAGNLGRGKFIYELFAITGPATFELYGSFAEGCQIIPPGKNVKWMGSFHPASLITEIRGKWGLIWDGDRIDDCNGQMGEYLRYNNPHKLSLYVAAGMPVIVPAKAATARFVLDNHIGIVIQSLTEIGEKLNAVSTLQYEAMLAKLDVMKTRIRSGYYFSSALQAVEREYCRHRSAA